MREVTSIALWLGVGFIFWTLLEYGLHRFVGHTWRTPLRLRHLEHHRDPLDYRFEPIWTILGLFDVALCALASWSLCLFALGMLAGYLHYEWLHWSLHFLGSGESVTSRGHFFSVEHHRRHHVCPAGNFAVTLPLWDRAFRTLSIKTKNPYEI